MKTKKWKDLLLAIWTPYVFLVTVALVGGYFFMYEKRGWGSWLFLLGFILACLAARRFEKIGKSGKRLSKDRKGIILRGTLVIAVISAFAAALYHTNTMVFVCMLVTSVAMFVFSFCLEIFFDWGKQTNVSV